MHTAKTVADYQTSGNPVIAIEISKKELIGDFKNAGKEWQACLHCRPQGI
ncbi:MAG: hypothetical protein IPN53_09895 [Comamonadaceae bacterium]|nr:hypothetical protein [Comamonadaceae bacterium]